MITICLQLDGSDEIKDVGLNHKCIENSEIVEASLAFVNSPQCIVRLVFQGGLGLISRIEPEYFPIGIYCDSPPPAASECQTCVEIPPVGHGGLARRHQVSHPSC